MNYVTYAIPFFIAAIVLELLWGRRAAIGNTYSFADTVNSLQLGTLSRLRGILQLGLLGTAFQLMIGNSLFVLDAGDPVVWICVFIAYDFCYYLSHRYGHEWRILWASHVAHHQSEEFNLSTALRQTSTGWLNSIFYLPLYILGVPVELMISVGSLNLIYQFWVHTEHIRRLGVLEYVMVTPSNHRVHHAKNPLYIDKNYGGVFIIWDRLLGTFQDEAVEQPCRYGITEQLNSWNPIWANTHVWLDTFKQSWQTPLWTNKVKVWFMSPGWHTPETVKPSYNWQAPKYTPTTSKLAKGLSLGQFIVHVPMVFILLGYRHALGEWQTLIVGLWLVAGFYHQGLLLEGRPVYKLELWRLSSGIFIAVTIIMSFNLTPYQYGLLELPLFIWGAILALYFIVSGVFNQINRSADHPQ